MQNASLASIISENREYWTGRAASYSEVNLAELATSQREKWSFCLRSEISRQLPDRTPSQIRVLEAGTGPGFFAILLSEAGYDVTAVDLTPAMLVEAKKNAGSLAGRIRFLEMNAESPDFPGGCFDVVVSRNLTWNLPHPDLAYAEWARMLKPGGLLLNFDANWYAYLFDNTAQAAYEQDRVNSAKQGVGDQNVGENFDVMENIARRMPLSGTRRPDWDLELLGSLGLQTEADEQVWQRVWSEQEKLNFSSTPLFLIRARKTSGASAPGDSAAG